MSVEEIDATVAELQDRYGTPTPAVENLARYSRIRVLADRIGLDSLDREGTTVILKFRQDAKIDPVPLLKLVETRGDLTLLPPAVLRYEAFSRLPDA